MKLAWKGQDGYTGMFAAWDELSVGQLVNQFSN